MPHLPRALLALVLVLAATATRAAAQTELVVLPPRGKDVRDVRAALPKARVGKLAKKRIDGACASDPQCLAKVGSELGARRVLAITVHGRRLTLMLVDADAKLLLGIRDVSIPRHKLERALGPSLRRFVDDVTADKAKELAAEGNSHFNQGELARALELYTLAYRVKPLPALQLSIAACQRKLGQLKEALATYEAYLAATPAAADKRTVASQIEEIEQALAGDAARPRGEGGAVEPRSAVGEPAPVEATAQPAEPRRRREPAQVASEPKVAGEPTRRAGAGERGESRERAQGAVAPKAAAEPARRADAGARGESRERAQGAVAPKAAAEPARRADAGARGDTRHPARPWMLLTGGMGLATVGAGAYFGVLAREDQRRFDAAGCTGAEPLDGATVAQCKSARKRGDRDAFLRDVLVGSGGAVVLASLIVYAIDPGHLERPARTGIAFTRDSVHFVVRW
jgi:tetratricopeptide (TPR) repeat protein